MTKTESRLLALGAGAIFATGAAMALFGKQVYLWEWMLAAACQGGAFSALFHAVRALLFIGAKPEQPEQEVQCDECGKACKGRFFTRRQAGVVGVAPQILCRACLRRPFEDNPNYDSHLHH